MKRKGNGMLQIIKTVTIVLFALAGVSTTGTAQSQTADSDLVKLIDIAGKQRMLSQRIAKDYLYLGNKIAKHKAAKQWEASYEEMEKGHKILSESINDPEIQNLLAFVQISREDFEVISKEEFSVENAQLVIDLSETMLEGSQYVVAALEAMVNAKKSKIVDISGRQRMLSQRIAKYYIAYKSGIKDKNTVEQMRFAVKLFDETHQVLMSNKDNTPEINRNLNKIDRLWKIVHKFYLNIEKGGLPLTVFHTTDDIMKTMNTVTGLYVEVYK